MRCIGLACEFRRGDSRRRCPRLWVSRLVLVGARAKGTALRRGGDGAIVVSRVLLRFPLRGGLLRGIKSPAAGGTICAVAMSFVLPTS
jgi:hypothetical protein